MKKYKIGNITVIAFEALNKFHLLIIRPTSMMCATRKHNEYSYENTISETLKTFNTKDRANAYFLKIAQNGSKKRMEITERDEHKVKVIISNLTKAEERKERYNREWTEWFEIEKTALEAVRKAQEEHEAAIENMHF